MVPPLAVAKSTTFRITARAGDAVAYEFEPHGTKFTLPLVVTQNLRNVKVDKNLLGLGLSLGYFPDSKQPTSVTELLNVNVDLLGQTAISTVWHFSGYIYASGRDGRGGEGGVERLHRDGALDRGLGGAEHHPHPSLTEHVFDLVAPIQHFADEVKVLAGTDVIGSLGASAVGARGGGHGARV